MPTKRKFVSFLVKDYLALTMYYAVADDGSVWYITADSIGFEEPWRQMTSLPPLPDREDENS